MVRRTFFTRSFGPNVITYNSSLNNRLEAHFPLLEQQFSRPTLDGLIPDGYSNFFNFSTGRRNVETLHATFTLLPRQDLAQMAIRFGWYLIELVYPSEDIVELDFKLSSSVNVPGFVWGVVSKDAMSKTKDGRWDLVSDDAPFRLSHFM